METFYCENAAVEMGSTFKFVPLQVESLPFPKPQNGNDALIEFPNNDRVAGKVEIRDGNTLLLIGGGSWVISSVQPEFREKSGIRAQYWKVTSQFRGTE